MAEKTGIQWCHHTWSPWRGCEKVSPGCASCYAEALSVRFPATFGVWGRNGKRVLNTKFGDLTRWNRAAQKAGERRRNFPSMCDWLEDRSELALQRWKFLDAVAWTPWLDHLLLTKRPENFVPLMKKVALEGGLAGRLAERWLAGEAPTNVWLGVSVENQEYADERIAILQETPAFLRWVSYEPALGPVVFASELKPSYHPDSIEYGVGSEIPALDWIVVGGESNQGGKQARPFDLEWARSAVAQCKAAGVPVFVKQMGAKPVDGGSPVKFADSHGGDMSEWPDDLRVREMPTPAKEVTRAK